MSFLEPRTYHGSYWWVDTGFGCYVVPYDHVGQATAVELSAYMPEGLGMCIGSPDLTADWTVELRTGWYGRLSADGYLDCTDWETADTEEELLESLTNGMDDDSDGMDEDSESDLA